LPKSSKVKAAGEQLGFGAFPNRVERAVKILNKGLPPGVRRYTKDALNMRRHRGMGPPYAKYGRLVMYPPEAELIAWRDAQFSEPMMSSEKRPRAPAPEASAATTGT
jgi:hypothetical protein